MLVCNAHAEGPSLKRTVALQGGEIRKELNEKRWSIEIGDDYILIKSLFKIERHSRVSPALTKAQNMETYVIRLDFKPMLPKNEYLKLALARAKHAVTLSYGTKTKEESYQSTVFLRDNALPRYTVNDSVGVVYGVYLTTSGDFLSSFSPLKDYAEAKGVEAIVDGTLWPLAQ